MNDTENLVSLCRSFNLKFKDNGNGHLQVSGQGRRVNYWPGSKNRTAHVEGGEVHHHCTPWAVVQLCLGNDQPPRGVTKALKQPNGPDEACMQEAETNPAGLTGFYAGELPPWDEALGPFAMSAANALRMEAYRILSEAEQSATRLREEARQLDKEGA